MCMLVQNRAMSDLPGLSSNRCIVIDAGTLNISGQRHVSLVKRGFQ